MYLSTGVFGGVLIIIGVAALMFPLLRYLRRGWLAKRRDILAGFDAEARLNYFQMFCRDSIDLSPAQASVRFEKLYSDWYGRKFFVLPAILLFFVALVAVALVVCTVLNIAWFGDTGTVRLQEPAIAALAGAYLWVVNDFISRACRLDFSPADVQWGALRLIIAIPMGYALMVLAAPSIGPFIAFALGAFPLETITTLIKRQLNKSMGLGENDQEATDDIIKLQGINRSIVERLAKEDVITVTQIAYCDPIQLVMRSNLTFNFVTDCMSQALVWLYLREKIDAIRPFGLRGAIEIKNLVDAFDDAGNPDTNAQAEHKLAIAAMPAIASAVGQTQETLQLVFREIAGDPYTCFLHEIWTGANAAVCKA